MEGPKLDQLEESELAPEDKHWKSIVNKDSKSATGKDAARIGTECRFCGENSAQTFLAFLATRGRVLHTVPAL